MKPRVKGKLEAQFWPEMEQDKKQGCLLGRGVVAKGVKRSLVVEMKANKWFDNG